MKCEKCKVRFENIEMIHRENSVWTKVVIDFCPLHEAVGEMLRTLKRIQSCHPKPGEMCPGCKTDLETAIVKAESQDTD